MSTMKTTTSALARPTRRFMKILLVDGVDEELGGVNRPALGHDPHHVERLKRNDEAGGGHERRARPEQRPCDVPEAYPAVGSIESRRLVQDRGDVL